MLVQCKQWKTRCVGVKVVREMLGVVVSRRANRGIIVTSGTFTAEARRFADDNSQTLELLDGSGLFDLIRVSSEAAGCPGRRASRQPATRTNRAAAISIMSHLRGDDGRADGEKRGQRGFTFLGMPNISQMSWNETDIATDRLIAIGRSRLRFWNHA